MVIIWVQRTMAKFEIQPASRRGVSIKMEISTQNELHTATGNMPRFLVEQFHTRFPPPTHPPLSF